METEPQYMGPRYWPMIVAATIPIATLMFSNSVDHWEILYCMKEHQQVEMVWEPIWESTSSSMSRDYMLHACFFKVPGIMIWSYIVILINWNNEYLVWQIFFHKMNILSVSEGLTWACNYPLTFLTFEVWLVQMTRISLQSRFGTFWR